jgi:hypothetical protein
MNFYRWFNSKSVMWAVLSSPLEIIPLVNSSLSLGIWPAVIFIIHTHNNHFTLWKTKWWLQVYIIILEFSKRFRKYYSFLYALARVASWSSCLFIHSHTIFSYLASSIFLTQQATEQLLYYVVAFHCLISSSIPGRLLQY